MFRDINLNINKNKRINAMYNILKLLSNKNILKDFEKYVLHKDVHHLTAKNAISRLGIDNHNASERISYILENYDYISRREKHNINLVTKYFLESINTYYKFIVNSYVQDHYHEVSLSDWEKICDSSELSFTAGYYGQAWVNHAKKEIIIVSAGTKGEFDKIRGSSITNLFGAMHFIKDLISDIQMIFQQVPIQYEIGARKFFNHVMCKIDFDKSDYNLVFTGHSLGGIFSDMLSLHSRGLYEDEFNHIYSVTYENPGSRSLVKKLYYEMVESGSLHEEFDLDYFQRDCFVINHSPNWFNSCGGEQFGRVYELASQRSISLEIDYKFLPDFVNHFLSDLMTNFEIHDKKYFSEIKVIIARETWPVRLFNQYFIENAGDIIKNLHTIYPNFEHIQNLFGDISEYKEQAYSYFQKMAIQFKDYVPDFALNYLGIVGEIEDSECDIIGAES